MLIGWTFGLASLGLSCTGLEDVFPLIDRAIAPQTFSGAYAGTLAGMQATTFAVDGRVETEVVSIPVAFTFGPHRRLQTCTYVGRDLTASQQVEFEYDVDIGYSGTSSHSAGYQRISNLVQSADSVEYDAEYYLSIFDMFTNDYRAITHFTIRSDGDGVTCRAERIVQARYNPGGGNIPDGSFEQSWTAEAEIAHVP